MPMSFAGMPIFGVIAGWQLVNPLPASGRYLLA
jgi:hypothetical protein